MVADAVSAGVGGEHGVNAGTDAAVIVAMTFKPMLEVLREAQRALWPALGDLPKGA